IQVEKIRGAVLLISGKDDCVWPSALMAERIVARLREHRHPFAYRHLSYDSAGHSFGLPNQARTNDSIGTFKMGGTPAGNAAAAEALAMVCNAHLAKDGAQGVFISLGAE